MTVIPAQPCVQLDDATRKLFKELERQVLLEAKSGGPPHLLCILASLARMSAKDRARCVEMYAFVGAAVPGGFTQTMAGYPQPASPGSAGRLGAIESITQLAREGSPEMKAQAVGALLHLIDGNPENQAKLANAGGLPALVYIAADANVPMQVRANVARALGLMAKANAAYGIAIGEAGGLTALIALVQTGSPSACSFAVFALRHLALCSPVCQAAIAHQGGIQPLVRLLTEGEQEACGYAAGALAALAEGNAENQVAIVAAGGILPLVSVLSESVDRDARRRAAGALAHLASNSAGYRELIALTGGIAPMIELTGEGVAEGAQALMCVVWQSAENQATALRLGAVPPLVALLQVGSPNARAHAAGALAALAEGGAECRAAIAAAGGVPSLAALLQDGHPRACKFAASALRHLTSPQGSLAQPSWGRNHASPTLA